MSRLKKAVTDYIEMRRALGYKLQEASKGLLDFVAFLDRRGASSITIPLALEWAQQKTTVQPAESDRTFWVEAWMHLLLHLPRSGFSSTPRCSGQSARNGFGNAEGGGPRRLPPIV